MPATSITPIDLILVLAHAAGTPALNWDLIVRLGGPLGAVLVIVTLCLAVLWKVMLREMWRSRVEMARLRAQVAESNAKAMQAGFGQAQELRQGLEAMHLVLGEFRVLVDAMRRVVGVGVGIPAVPAKGDKHGS